MLTGHDQAAHIRQLFLFDLISATDEIYIFAT